jgi:hypothetical protein
MTLPHDTQIAEWLADDAGEGPPEALARALAATRRTRKRARWTFPARWIPPQSGTFAKLGMTAVAVAAVGLVGLTVLWGPGPRPTVSPIGSAEFVGTWVSTSDTDGGTQTMTVTRSGDTTIEIVVTDSVATACSGTPSTMIGTGRIDGATRLVIPVPVYTCDDGSDAQTTDGTPMEQQLRDWTLFLDPGTDTLSDSAGGVWLREGGDAPSPMPSTSATMWPQSTIEEVRYAQEMADAGDAAYTWQVDRRLYFDEWYAHLFRQRSELVDRFLRQELGWDRYLFSTELPGVYPSDPAVRRAVYLRCAPGGRNPLYPIAAEANPGGEQCAPTIDELRYETVSLDLAQPGRRGVDGIWVVSDWATITPFTQTDPVAAQEVATAKLQDFLAARILGRGAEGYVDVVVSGWPDRTADIPLLYATTTGAPYERSELALVGGPEWPSGDMDFEVRLFADRGETMVEQLISWSNARLFQDATGTTENGQPVAGPYVFLDGEVTLSAALPWDSSPEHTGLILGNASGRLELAANPLPILTNCDRGPTPADAEALAASVQRDRDFVATAPVAVRVGGLDGLVMDVTAAAGASICDYGRSPAVLSQGDGFTFRDHVLLQPGRRMRLYLLDVPKGSPTRILAIAIVGTEARFDVVIAAAAPVLESIEFHAR